MAEDPTISPDELSRAIRNAKRGIWVAIGIAMVAEAVMVGIVLAIGEGPWVLAAMSWPCVLMATWIPLRFFLPEIRRLREVERRAQRRS